MRLSEGNPFKTCANNPQKYNQKLSRANVYESKMLYRDLDRSGASPREGLRGLLARGSKSSSKQSRKSLRSLKTDFLEFPELFFKTVSDTFSTPRRKARETQSIFWGNK